jgi:hypothetical protein
VKVKVRRKRLPDDRFWPRLCKNAEKSAHEKSGFLEPPLCDFLGIGNGHPTRENFMFLRFYTAWTQSGRRP